MFLHKILRALERIEKNQQLILSRLGAAGEGQAEEADRASASALLQAGIDNIMAYEVGKRKEDSR